MTDQPLDPNDTPEEAYQKGFADGELQGYQRGIEEAQALLGGLLSKRRQSILHVAAGKLDYDVDIEQLGLSIQSYRALRRAGINTIGHLSMRSSAELSTIRGLGLTRVAEIVDKLAGVQITLPNSIIDPLRR